MDLFMYLVKYANFGLDFSFVENYSRSKRYFLSREIHSAGYFPLPFQDIPHPALDLRDKLLQTMSTELLAFCVFYLQQERTAGNGWKKERGEESISSASFVV